MENGFSRRYRDYQDYQRKIGKVRSAGGFLLDIGEKNEIHFLGISETIDGSYEDELITFQTAVRSQEELQLIVEGIELTPVFRKMLRFILITWELKQIPLIQGMPKIGKTLAYRTFKNLVYGHDAPFIYLDCKPDTSGYEIRDAIRNAYVDPRQPAGDGAFLLVDHFDNLPLGVQVIFRLLRGHGGKLAEEINEYVLGHYKRGSKTFVGFEATYPEIIEGKNTIEVGVAARVVWLAIPPTESQKYGS